MSVFTTLTEDEVAVWLQQFDIGQLQALKGIAAGITNTNYFVITDKSRYVLTIFEKNTQQELPYFVHLMSHLANHGVPCPAPVADRQGTCLHMLHGKPALMVTCLQGKDIAIPDVTHIQQVATTLAQMHIAGASFAQAGVNQRNEAWRTATAEQVLPKLKATDKAMLQAELAYQHSLDVSALPTGVIHGDLFRDNVLFDGDKLGGFIDFYYACHDILLYDVAIAVNEWCLHHNGPDLGLIDEDKMQVFLDAYQSVRPFAPHEWKLWLAMLRRASLRFWLSRLYDFYFPQDGELTHTKDPNHFKNLLQQYLDMAVDLGE